MSYFALTHPAPEQSGSRDGKTAGRTRRVVWLALTLILISPWAQASSNSAEPVRAGEKHVRRLVVWSRSSASQRSKLDTEKVSDTITRAMSDPLSDNRGRELDLALLALLGHARGPGASQREESLASYWRGGLQSRLRRPGADRTLALITDEILGLEPDEDFQPEHFLGAAESLVGRYHPRSLKGLARLALATHQPESVRAAAGRALAGWQTEAASTALLEAVLAAPPPGGLAEQTRLLLHLRELERKSGIPTEEVGWTEQHSRSLARAGLRDLVSPDWRLASRAISLARYTDPEVALPRLVEALAAWEQRLENVAEGESLTGLLRVRNEIGETLRSLSGAEIGPHVDRWRHFLSSRRISGAPLRPNIEPSQRTVAGFFGLPIDSGSIAFVIDRSGSMRAAAPAGSGSKNGTSAAGSRFDAARIQLFDALSAAGETTQFHVVLFSDQGRVWRDAATPASKTGLTSARKWLNRQNPDGGTHLSTGFEELINLGSGTMEDGRLAFDTVIVLCDGETVEGSTWARDWLRRFGHPAGLRIHAVQIGGARAAALRTLCSETGGTLVEL